MKPLRISGLAQDELREAFEWYEDRGKALGRRFVMAVDRAFAEIGERPQQHPVVYENIRRAMVRRFPYGVFFQEETQCVRVIAVVHLHRHPDTWKRRT